MIEIVSKDGRSRKYTFQTVFVCSMSGDALELFQKMEGREGYTIQTVLMFRKGNIDEW